MCAFRKVFELKLNFKEYMKNELNKINKTKRILCKLYRKHEKHPLIKNGNAFMMPSHDYDDVISNGACQKLETI